MRKTQGEKQQVQKECEIDKKNYEKGDDGKHTQQENKHLFYAVGSDSYYSINESIVCSYSSVLSS